MKIVHEVDYPVQLGGSGTPYVQTISEPSNKWKGWRADLFFVVSNPLDPEVIRIEGDAKYLRQMFLDALEILDGTEDALKEGTDAFGTNPDLPKDESNERAGVS